MSVQLSYTTFKPHQLICDRVSWKFIFANEFYEPQYGFTYAVGYGGSPDEDGETTLDAMIMDGTTMDVGAVGAIRNVKDAIRAARLVLQYTDHTLLVGDQATVFALSLGLGGPSNLTTDQSLAKWLKWKESDCQPNFWRNVMPSSNTSCGPYSSIESFSASNDDFDRRKDLCSKRVGFGNHDTISMAAIDKEGRIAAGTSTNGASYKIPGRVGDGPIVGAGAYADQEVGACGATGDGDVMMRFLPCYQVVENMRLGMSPVEAAENAISRIKRKYPAFIGAIVALNMKGEHGGACHGWTFQYSVQTTGMEDVNIFTVYPAISS
ncbi:hypothetical protein KP509_02G071500 [Ceratopteris richardii]|uniref:beta-aspartyl-peptidase n=1 Tax=Ceratopteris richardii TaxID=49495 RepID=A0A8T2VEU2_CERRI|nr:hypothetical protein KP509_02G071500 [Ceratopteris richardii]